MGRNGWPVYGDADVGSAIEDVEKIIGIIKTNKFDKRHLITLHNANAELIKAIISNEYED